MALIKRYVLFFLSLLFINILLVGATLANTTKVGGYEEQISSWDVAPINTKKINFKTFNCFDYLDLIEDGICWCGTEDLLHSNIIENKTINLYRIN